MLFNKPYSKITSRELSEILNILLEFSDTLDENNQIELSQIIQLLPNLKRITISNSSITNNYINQLSILKIESLLFENCSFSENVCLKNFNNLKDLNFYKCALLDYNILNDLNKEIVKISIINPIDENVIDMNIFINYLNLAELYLENCVIQNINVISKLQNLKIVSFLWSDIVEINKINVLLTLKKLNDIYLSDNYKELDEVKELSSKKHIYFNLNHLVYDDEERIL